MRLWASAFVGCVVAVLISIRFLDHPIADYLELHFRHTESWILLARALAPLTAVVLLALFFLFWAGGCRLAGRSLSMWTEKPLILAWTIVWALATEFVFKQIFGRAWPEPTYIQDHMDGFRFLHASDHWMAFPSGHALNSFAQATALGLLIPKWRRTALLASTAISIAMVVCNYHWLSDVIAGSFLGVAIGAMTVKLKVSAY